MSQKEVIINVGLPGSGKSTYAIEYIQKNKNLNSIICSADDYFINSSGKYVYVPSKIKNAHDDCKKKFVDALHDPNIDVIIVDNTNLQKMHRDWYVNKARENGVKVKIVLAKDFEKFLNAPEDKKMHWLELFAKRYLHGVDLQTLQRMLTKYDPV